MNKKIILLLLSIFTISSVYSQKEPDDIIKKFFKIYEKEMPSEAIDYLYEDSVWKTEVKSEIDNLKIKLLGAHNTMGENFGEFKYAEKNLSNTFIVIHYLVKYERQPLRFEFKFYKPNKDWVFYGFSFDSNISSEMSEALNLKSLEVENSQE